MFFNLGANKKDLLHGTHGIISFLPFCSNSFISKLFQHVMSFTYEHVLFISVSYEYVENVQKIINKGTNVNAKGENGKKNLFAVNM
jgi:hypothetical protein